MNLHPSLVFLGGLVVIIVGAELLLRGASRIAAMLGIKPIVIGLTVVAMGTSAPELAVGITAVLDDRGPLAVGNVAGTNIFNILFILGLSAAIRSLPLQLLSVRLDLPVMVGATLGLLVMAADGTLSRVEGVSLLCAAAVYTVVLVTLSRRETAALKREFAEEYGAQAATEGLGALGVAWNVTLFVFGLGLTLLGADLLVAGAVAVARELGVSDAIIGLTIVAIGTSAPELATTVVATFKDDRDIAVGNLIGSSISNILFILGATCVVAPSGVAVSDDVLAIDLPLATAVAIVCLPVFRSDRMISRFEGGSFVLVYVAYMATLVFVRA